MEPWDQLKEKTRELLDEGNRTGVLTPEEHRWRLQHLEAANSPEALDALVEDLLEPAEPRNQVAPGAPAPVTILSQRTLVLDDLGRRTEIVTILGSTRVDLAGLGDRSLTLEVVTLLGDVVIEVPEGVKVRLNATPVLGDCSVPSQHRGPGATVTVNGVAILGSVKVVTRGGKSISS